MKMNLKPIAYFGIATLALTACQENDNQKLSAVRVEVVQTDCPEVNTDSLEIIFSEVMEDIETNIRMVNETHGILELEENEEIPSNQKDRIIEGVQLMNTLMSENKKKLKNLQALLGRSQSDNMALKESIADAEARIESQEILLSEIKSDLAQKKLDIESLNAQLSTYELDNAKLRQDITSLEDDLHTAYVAKGSYKELKERNVADKDGGVLGLGRTKSLADNFDPSQFEQIDIRKTKTIAVDAKKVHLLTEHPASSYSLKREDKEIACLNITNPDEFWKANKFLVMEIKR